MKPLLIILLICFSTEMMADNRVAPSYSGLPDVCSMQELDVSTTAQPLVDRFKGIIGRMHKGISAIMPQSQRLEAAVSATDPYFDTSRIIAVGSIWFLLGGLSLAAIFALGLYWFSPRDLSSFLFVLVCLGYSLWVISSDSISYLVFEYSPDTVKPLQLLSLVLLSSIYSYFLYYLTDRLIKSWIFHLIAAVSAIGVLGMIISVPAVYSEFLPYLNLVYVAVFLLISTRILKLGGFKGSLVILTAASGFLLSGLFLYRSLAAFELVSEALLISIFGSLIFIVMQTMALIVRFGRNYREYSMAAMAASQTRDEFLNTMSHELKTPMNAILGMATFLEKSELNRQQKDKLNAIKSNSESLLSLINDILSISEIGTGRLNLKLHPINLEGCVESAISLSRQHQQKDRVRLEVKMDDDIPELLRGDGSRVKQILMHLLSNAFKYTKKGVVRLELKMLRAEAEFSEIGFYIEDTGVGINKSDRAGIFEKFRKGEIGNARKYGGVGLGLSVVNELINLMEGKLKVYSTVNVGTRVEFSLRFQNHIVSAMPEVKSIFKQNEVDTSLKILYAEDNPVNQKLLQMILQSYGLKIDIASNGKEAVEMSMKKYYNIIFMDIQMPEMDGLEASRRIVTNSASRPIIIAVTANMAEVDKPKCFEAGMNDFLHKPVQQEELKLAIIKWQGLKKYLDDSGENTIKLSS